MSEKNAPDWVAFYSKFWSSNMLRLNQLLGGKKMSLTLSLEFQFTTSIEKAWSALTDSSKLAKWIADNDFKPEVGQTFQFRHQPYQYWDGIVDGEVLEVEAPNSLTYCWSVGDERQTVTWTLQESEDGIVNLHLEQTGFSTAEGLEGAKYGWTEWFSKFDSVLVS